MTVEDLEDLGFELSGARDDPDLAAELMTPIANPISRQFISRATFRLREGRLMAVAPPDLAGLPPLPVEGISRMSDVSARLQELFDEAILRLQRRSAELLSLGLSPDVDPATLELSAVVNVQDLAIQIAADRAGRFHVASAMRRGAPPLQLPSSTSFELSEFRDPHALAAFLEAMVTGEPPTTPAEPARPAEPAHPAPAPDAAAAAGTLTLRDLAERFGPRAMVPVRTPVELVVDLSVGGVPHRFAASRLVNRTFRGLLAGPSGKVWAGRFELDAFPGIAALAARELGVDEDAIELGG